MKKKKFFFHRTGTKKNSQFVRKHKRPRSAKAIWGGKQRAKLEDLILIYLISKYKAIIKMKYYSIYRSLVSLGRYIPKYFILFIAMVNGVVSLISLFSHY